MKYYSVKEKYQEQISLQLVLIMKKNNALKINRELKENVKARFALVVNAGASSRNTVK